VKICAACGEQNPDKAKFCLECGGPLAEPTPRQEERKVVTVLFADLVGFTSRSERMDVEDVRGTLQPYHQLLRRELERHGGTVEKFIGDAVMALFGAPTAHEDDPERAVRAALAIQGAVAQLRVDNERLDLHVRIGVNTGEALVALGARPSEGEGMASGDVVNTAARLQSAAPVDGVLVGGGTYRATDRVIRYQEAEPIHAKGKSGPVRVWQAIEPRSLLPEQARRDDLPLVGRVTELGLLVGAFERSRSEPSTQLVTIVGAPGIGKTRLVEELARHVEELPGLIRWRRGRSLAYGEGVAFWALGEIVKAEAGVLESDPADDAETKLRDAVEAVVRDERDSDWLTGHLRPLLGLERRSAAAADSGRVEVFAAWRRFFEALAEDGPTVLVFEDLHWADDALLDFIDLLAERAGSVPLVLVCTARPELLERRTAWGGGKTNVQTLLLSPLREADTARLVAALLEQALLPAETQAALLVRSEGNPLYAQEYVRMLRDRGLLVREAGGWRLVGEPDVLPESVQGIIAARLDALSPDEKRFIHDASVIGKRAWLGAVCAISGASHYEAEERLHGLERKQLLSRSRSSSVASEVEFSFTNALTQEVAYGQIKRGQRAERHERAAEWITPLAAERDDKAELLAHHYHTAYQLRRELGQAAGELRRRAQAALADAGRQAVAVNAHEAAARHIAASLELTPTDDPTRAALVLDHATARWRAETVDEQTLNNARDAQVAAGDPAAAAWAEYMLAWWAHDQGQGGAQIDDHIALAARYESALPRAARSGYIDAFRAWRLYLQARFQDVITLADDVLSDTDSSGLPAARLLSFRGCARVELGDPDGVQDVAASCDIAAAANNSRDAAVAYGNLAVMTRALGDLATAEQAFARGLHFGEMVSSLHSIPWINFELAAINYHRGHWSDALRKTSVPTSNQPLTCLASGVRGRIAVSRGATRRALTDARSVIEVAAATHNLELKFLGHTLCALAEPSNARAARACAAFLDEWRRVGGILVGVENLAEIAPIAAAHGWHDELRAAADLVRAPSRWTDAVRAVAAGDPLQAAGIFEDIGSLPNAARARLDAARQLFAQGRRGEGEAQAEQSLHFWRQVGASAYIDQCEALLARTASA
jgi:class 3 adenylate cyclase